MSSSHRREAEGEFSKDYIRIKVRAGHVLDPEGIENGVRHILSTVPAKLFKMIYNSAVHYVNKRMPQDKEHHKVMRDHE